MVPLQVVWETSSPIPINRKIVESNKSIDLFIGVIILMLSIIIKNKVTTNYIKKQ